MDIKLFDSTVDFKTGVEILKEIEDVLKNVKKNTDIKDSQHNIDLKEITSKGFDGFEIAFSDGHITLIYDLYSNFAKEEPKILNSSIGKFEIAVINRIEHNGDIRNLIIFKIFD